MNKAYFGIICLVLFCLFGCQTSDEASIPILMRGFLKLDSSIESTYKPEDKDDCHALVQIINKSTNSVIGETDIKNIVDFPVLFVIRKNFYDAYKNYWDEYEVKAYVYEKTDKTGEVLQGVINLDLYNYSYVEDITVK